MFVIAVLGGGFRTQELYNDHLYVQDNRLHIYRTKTNETRTNPIMLQLSDVVRRHNGLPEFLKVDEFRACLQTIGKQIPLDRIISVPDTYINSRKDMRKVKIQEIFNPYFARKTCVTVLNHLGLTKDEIIEFTTHSDVRKALHFISSNSICSPWRMVRRILLLKCYCRCSRLVLKWRITREKFVRVRGSNLLRLRESTKAALMGQKLHHQLCWTNTRMSLTLSIRAIYQ